MADFDLIVIGGGAAGFYGAIQAAEMYPGLKILILEKSNKLLSKVRVSGGGRCNVTHNCFDPVKLSHHYPRGEKPLRSLFKIYDAKRTVGWFASKGVDLKIEEDGRMFPVSDSSQTVIDCFLREADRLKINIEMGDGVETLEPARGNFKIGKQSGKMYTATRVLIATGGSPKIEAYHFIEKLGHTVKSPIPSLFTFNDSGKNFADLMGIAVQNAEVRIATTKFKQQGPLLITHWGLSGPAVIKLSAWAAEYLSGVHYNFTALVSWIGPAKEETLREHLGDQKISRSKQKICSNPLFELPQRLWVRLCEMSEIPPEKVWGEIGQKNLNKLLENLSKCPFQIKGKTTFKEEFVTCGGVDLKEIGIDTMESKKIKGIFFAGEVLNIDGETGGFNFQSAWSTAYIAANKLFSPGGV
ncbi:MAG: NAD(P)/FAD-dependent oxidoreductase [Cyclobacteriaceae bacterium]